MRSELSFFRIPALAANELFADDSIRAMMLIRTYRVRGHLAADLDPLGPIAASLALATLVGLAVLLLIVVLRGLLVRATDLKVEMDAVV